MSLLLCEKQRFETKTKTLYFNLIISLLEDAYTMYLVVALAPLRSGWIANASNFY